MGEGQSHYPLRKFEETFFLGGGMLAIFFYFSFQKTAQFVHEKSYIRCLGLGGGALEALEDM